MKLKVTGAASAKKRLESYAAGLQRETVSILKQEARTLCVELGAATLPGPGLAESTGDKFRAAVGRDVRRVFSSKQIPSSIFNLLKVHAPHLAGAYWHAVMSGKKRAAADLVRRANLPQGLDPSALRNARTGKNGRVPKNHVPVSLATEAQVRAFEKRQMQLVGVAKAGYYCAAKGLGGRVRRNLVSATGKRSTEEAFPAYIRKLAGKFPNLGGARITEGASPRVEIFTRVKHANAALPAGLYAAAVSAAEKRVRRDLELSMKELARRGRKRAA